MAEHDYNHYLGPLVWGESGELGPSHWRAPVSATGLVKGLVDLRPTPQQAMAGAMGDNPYAFFTVDGTLDSDYELLGSGSGDATQLALTAGDKATWLSLTGYEPKGTTLSDALLDHLTDGSDPTGQTGVMSLMPTVQGNLDVHMGGYSRIAKKRFNYNSSRPEDQAYLDRFNIAIHAQYQMYHDAEMRGDIPEHKAAQVYDYWIDKFKLNRQDKASIQRLLPVGLRKDHRGPVKHQTIITDDFNRPNEADFDGSTSSEGFTWDVYIGDAQLLNNQLSQQNSEQTYMKAEIDLCSSDHYSQQEVIALQTGGFHIATARNDLFDDTLYQAALRRSGLSTFQIQKRVDGVQTTLAVVSSTIPVFPLTLRLTCNGSSLILSVDGSPELSTTHTDTAIDGGLRCGISWFADIQADNDDFEAADLAVGVTPTPYYHHMLDVGGR